MSAPLIVIFGVSGVGKTMIGQLLSERTGIPFIDADDHHSPASIEKMSSGIPLTDADRLPWLVKLASILAEAQHKSGAILACSALKEDYRMVLSSEVQQIQWVLLNTVYEKIYERLEERFDHFMKADLLRSQFETLEIPDYGLHLDATHSPSTLTQQIIEYYALRQ